MCDLEERTGFVRQVRTYLHEGQGIECEAIGNKSRTGFWVTDARWSGASGGRIGFATACSDERPAAFREPHRLTPCFHVAPEFRLGLNLHGETLIAMPQWYPEPFPGYMHLWLAETADGSETNIVGSEFTSEFGDRVLRLLRLIQPG